MEESLKLALKAESANKAKSEFLANMSTRSYAAQWHPGFLELLKRTEG
jgi:hypothetical protein